MVDANAVYRAKILTKHFPCIRICTLIYIYSLWLCWIFVFVYSFSLTGQLKAYKNDIPNPLSLSYFTQIKQDWNEFFLTDIILINANSTTSSKQQCPLSHPSDIVSN